MNTNLFREVYKQACNVTLKDCPPASLSDFLHGYLTVYSMVQVYPWLESELDGPWETHERVREIARVVGKLLKDTDTPVDTRAGYAVDLMDAYLLYSDINFLDIALDTTYEILSPYGSDKIVLPCRTANICRLLCNCYYFTSEEETGELAGRLFTEALGLSRKFTPAELIDWWKAFQVYESVLGEMEVPATEQERLRNERFRLGVSVEQLEDEKIETFQRTEISDIPLLGKVFDILAKREFAACNERYRLKE